MCCQPIWSHPLTANPLVWQASNTYSNETLLQFEGKGFQSLGLNPKVCYHFPLLTYIIIYSYYGERCQDFQAAMQLLIHKLLFYEKQTQYFMFYSSLYRKMTSILVGGSMLFKFLYLTSPTLTHLLFADYLLKNPKFTCLLAQFNFLNHVCRCDHAC